MTTPNTNVASNPVLTSALQAALQGKTDLFSMIDGSKGFAALLQQLDIDQADVAQAQVDAKSERSQADDHQTSPEVGDAMSQNRDDSSSRVVARTDPLKKADVRKKDDVSDEDGHNARVEDRALTSDDVVSTGKTDADDVLEGTTVIAVDTPSQEEKADAAPDASSVQVRDVVAPQAHVPEAVGQHLLPQQAQHAVKEQTGGDDAGNVSRNMPANIVQDITTPQATPTDASGDGHSGARKNQVQSALAHDDAGFPDGAPVGEMPVDPEPEVKPETTSKQEVVSESPDLPKAHEHQSPNGTSPSMAALTAASRPAETPASTASQHTGNIAKIDSSGLRLYESVGKLTQGYDQAAQLTAPKSAKSTASNTAQVIEQVTIRLNQQAKSGLDQMTIQLRPADLGRVDIKLNFHDGAVTALVTADSQTTLDILAKDSRSLERALQDAGLRADSGSLSFQLRDPGGRGTSQDERNPGSNAYNFEASEELLAELTGDDEVAIIEPNRVNLRV